MAFGPQYSRLPLSRQSSTNALLSRCLRNSRINYVQYTTHSTSLELVCIPPKSGRHHAALAGGTEARRRLARYTTSVCAGARNVLIVIADPDTTGYIEAPETPAPVFAVRAFKHAIFGTPQTVQPKPRRHSTTDNARARPQVSKPERPLMMRPKSAGDARGLGKDDDAPIPSPVASPTKGILMTPGTAATKRKTVTFGEHVTDNEDKRPSKSGIPDDCPGKFPSPWTKASVDAETPEAPLDKGRGRSKLTEALEQVRDESAKRNARSHKRTKSRDEDAIAAAESEAPVTESALYWKTQYDVYRDNSQREIKKLITKQKAAKSFAREKDYQCTELADELRQERKKVEKLEKRSMELEAQLEAMREELKMHREREGKASEVIARSEPARDQARRVSPPTEPLVLGHGHPTQPVAPTVTDTTVEPPQVKTLAEDLRPPPDEADKPKEPIEAAKPRTRARPTHARTKTNDDIWDQSIKSSSPVMSRDNKVPPAGRAVTSGTGATPLMSLSVNTLPTANLTRRDSAQPSPPGDRFAKEPLVRQEVIRSRVEEPRKEEPVLSPGLPLPSPEPRAASQSPTRHNAIVNEATDDLSIPVPASSPFQPSPVMSPPDVASRMSNIDRLAQAPSKSADNPTATTTVAQPDAKTVPTENVKPTAAWNAINAPNVAKRVTSITDKSGKEVGLDRIEAAKARMAARGRVLS